MVMGKAKTLKSGLVIENSEIPTVMQSIVPGLTSVPAGDLLKGSECKGEALWLPS